MRLGIVIFPGSTCDYDAYHAGKQTPGIQVEYVWYTQRDISGYDALILSGGFSYGDYLRAGAIAQFAPVMKGVREFANNGRLVLGICNGFQILLEAGLLPGAMLKNASLKFICKWVYLHVENNTTPFTSTCNRGQVLKIPIAHNEGNYFTDKNTLERLHANNQIVFRYCDPEGNITKESNPNGSVDNIAGICNPQGNVLGMMPHPERAMESILGSTDGRLIFKAMVNSVIKLKNATLKK